jgi:hypothetical protein
MSLESKVESILSHIGSTLKKVFTGTVAQDILKTAEVAEPLVALAFPGVAALYAATVSEVAAAETAAIAAGAQTGTGAQKLAAVVAAITPTFNAYLKAQGLPTQTAETVEKWVNTVVAGLNSIAATTTTTTDSAS